MGLAIRTLGEAEKNHVFPLKDGLTLGRQGASVQLDDPRVSTLHAKIQQKEAGGFVLVDMGSKNGVRSGNLKVDQLELVPGTTFYLGDSGFEVIDLTPKKAAKPAKKQRYWHEILNEYVADEISPSVEDRLKPTYPLDPGLVLDFVRGAQANTRWILGFGPRKIGASSLDLPIWEPGAPAVCFEIIPSNDGLLFRTAHPELVRLNGESVDSEVLRMGDTILIKDTVIEVDFTG